MKPKTIFLIMTAILLVLTTQLIIISAETDSTYFFNIEIDYDDKEFTVTSVELINTIAKISYPDFEEGEYSFEILDENGNTIEKKAFYFSTTFYYDIADDEGNIVSGGAEERDKFSFNIRIPQYDTMRELVLYDSNGNEISREQINGYLGEDIEIEFGEVTEETGQEFGQGTTEIFRKIKSIDLDNLWQVSLIICLIILFAYFISLVINMFQKKKKK